MDTQHEPNVSVANNSQLGKPKADTSISGVCSRFFDVFIGFSAIVEVENYFFELELNIQTLKLQNEGVESNNSFVFFIQFHF